MENYLFLQKCITDGWLSSSPTSWAVNIILAFLCGLGLFFLLLPYFQTDSSSLPCKKYRSSRKHHGEPRRRSSRTRKKNQTLKVFRDCLQELEEVQDLFSLLQSHLGRLSDQGDFHQFSREAAPRQARRAEPAGAHQPCRGPVEGAAPAVAPSPPRAPLRGPARPLASTLPAERVTSSISVHSHSSLSTSWPSEAFLTPNGFSHRPLALLRSPPCLPSSEASPPPPTASSAPGRPDSPLTFPQCGSRAPPLCPIPQSLSPRSSWLGAPIPAITGLGRSSCSVSALSWWQVTAKAWNLSTSTRLESHQAPLSPCPPEALFWGDPTRQEEETRIPPFINPDVQKLLEIVIAKRTELRIWKEKEKREGSDGYLTSFGRMFKSPGDKQGTEGCQSFWNMRGKPKQLLGPETLPHPTISGDSVEQKCSQLFWGLPFLHSESLVATVRVLDPPLEFPSVIFNERSHALPLQIQANGAPRLSVTQSLPDTLAGPQPLPPSLSQSLPLPVDQFLPLPLPLDQPQSQAHLAPSDPVGPPSLPPETGTCEVSCPVSEKTPSLISTAVQNLESHFLKKQLESIRTLPAVVKRSQEVFSQGPPDLPQDGQAPEGHGSVSVLPMDLINSEFREQLELHLWKKLMKQRSGPCPKIQLSVKLIPPHGEFQKVPQAHHWHSLTSESESMDGNCQATQKTGSRYPGRTVPGKSLGKDSRSSAGKIRKDLRRGSTSSLEESPGIKSEESDPDLKTSTSSADEKCSEKGLRAHLGGKLGQIRDGQIPWDVRCSRLTAHHASDLPRNPSPHGKPGNPPLSKGWEPYMTTSHDFSILSPYTQRMLEAHIIRFRVKHQWGLPLKVLKPINLFKLKKGFLLSHFATPRLATCVSKPGSRTEFLEKPPQPCQGAQVIKAPDPTSGGPLPAPQPTCKKIQQALEWPARGGGGHGPLETSAAGQEARQPSQTLAYSLVGRIWHSEIASVTLKNSSLESRPSPAEATKEPKRENGGRASRESCCSVTVLEVNLEPQYLSAKESGEAGEVEETLAWEVTSEPSVLTKHQSFHADLRRSGSSGKSDSPPPSTKSVTQDPEELCLEAQLRAFELQKLVKSQKQPQDATSNVLLQDCETGVLLQDCATEGLLQDCQSNVFLAADVLASQGSLSGFQSGASEDTATSQVLYGLKSCGHSVHRQPGPSGLWHQPKSLSRSCVHPEQRENYREPNPRDPAKELSELKIFQISEMRHPGQSRESAETSGNKVCQVLLKKEEAPPEGYFRRRVRHLLQWAFSRRGKGREASLHKGEPSPPRSQGRVMGRPAVDTASAEAQVLMTAVGRVLEEKVLPQRGLQGRELSWCQRDLRASAGPNVCYQRVLSYQEQRRVMRATASSQLDSPKGHSCASKTEWMRWPLPGRVLGCPGRHCQHRPLVPGAAGRPPHPHCPRHCLLQRYFSSGQSLCASHAFPGQTAFLQEKMQTVQRKTFFSHVSTSSMG